MEKKTPVFTKVYPEVEKSSEFKNVKKALADFAKAKKISVFVLSSPLVNNYNYDYKYGFLILIPGYKLIFSSVKDENNNDEFNYYREDFLEDLSSISDRYDHKNVIGRKRNWLDLITTIPINTLSNFEEYCLKGTDKRKAELLISLLTGSINDAHRVGNTEPEDLLGIIKKRIILFDVDQTRFIYHSDHNSKQVTIQGLAGTGKTELLLHKLFNLYTNESKDINTKIVFTCFNKILANDMEDRITNFFNFMKADQQIAWNKRLWVMRSWGSEANPNSGIYSFICNFYNITFYRYSPGITFKNICDLALAELNQVKDFKPCFDYILIDEGQDFDDSFFRLCQKITTKQVIVASDIFQNIFEKNSKVTHNPDFTLSKVYRTDPKNFMFAQLLGFGVNEHPVINWLNDETWATCGYKVVKSDDEQTYKLSREPLNRFDDLIADPPTPLKIFVIPNEDLLSTVINKIKEIIDNNISVTADDIGIVFLSNNSGMYRLADRLEIKIMNEFGWESQKGYEEKHKSKGKIFISNKNNIKGLEFPFVICIANGLIAADASIRNALYMALTRSFITSYLISSDSNEDLINKYRDVYNEIMDTGIATVKKPQPDDIMSDTDRSILRRKTLTQSQVVDELCNTKKITNVEKIKRLKKVVHDLYPNGDNDSSRIEKVIDSFSSLGDDD